MVGISDLSKEVAKKTGQTQKVAREIIKEFLDTVVEQVDKKEKINLAGFGIFERRTQKARIARNPSKDRRGEQIKVPAKEKFVFRPSSKIKYKS
ncbi:HU family DNA-binding protein [Caldiplasma sukawensis]